MTRWQLKLWQKSQFEKKKLKIQIIGMENVSEVRTTILYELETLQGQYD